MHEQCAFVVLFIKTRRGIRGTGTDMKKIKYVILSGIITAFICIFLLFTTAYIPQSAIQKQMKESAEYYSEHLLFDRVTPFSFLSRQDNYADCILTNIIYHIDSENILTSILSASYYNPEGEEVNESFSYAVDHPADTSGNDKIVLNVDYSRYWHGSMVLLRPLFMFFNIRTIRMILGIFILLLTVWFVYLLIRKKYLFFAGCYIVGLLSVSAWMCAFCVEYTMPFLVMAVELPVLFLLMTKEVNDKKDGYQEKILWCVLAASGIVTAFLDFLTTETLTFTVAYMLYLVVRSKRGQIEGLKKECGRMIKSGAVWGISYALMFFLKWIMACIFLGKDAFVEALRQATFRMNGDATLGNVTGAETVSDGERIFGALWRNFACLLPFRDSMKVQTTMIVLVVTAVVAFCIWYLFRTKKVNDVNRLFGMLAIIPVVRFLVLNNHSYIHFFFTYRALLVTVVVLVYVLGGYMISWRKKTK